MGAVSIPPCGEAVDYGSVIETRCGLFIDPLDPDPEQFRIFDIAQALSRICRFQGHTNRHYSVAEHSLYVGDILKIWGGDKNIVLDGLMHDSSEAYIPDLASPLKHSPFGAAFREAEDRLMSKLAQRFGFRWPMSAKIKQADAVLLWCEAHVLMAGEAKSWPAYEQVGRRVINANPSVCHWIDEAKYERRSATLLQTGIMACLESAATTSKG